MWPHHIQNCILIATWILTIYMYSKNNYNKWVSCNLATYIHSYLAQNIGWKLWWILHGQFTELLVICQIYYFDLQWKHFFISCLGVVTKVCLPKLFQVYESTKVLQHEASDDKFAIVVHCICDLWRAHG